MGKNKLVFHYTLSQVFFLFNFVGIASPIALTNFLAVLGYKHLLTKRFFKIIVSIGVIATLYTAVHLYLGIHLMYYLKSSAYYILLFISSYIAFKYIKKNRMYMEQLFRFSCVSIFVLFCTGLLIYNTEFADYLWKKHDFIGDGRFFKRFKGLAYEPSHFALIISPLVIYSFLNLYRQFSIKNVMLFSAVFIPAIATISFGFVAAFFAGFLLLIVIVYLKYRRVERLFVWLLLIGLLSSGTGIMLNEGLRERVVGVFSGKDTSVNGRTYEAFDLAYKCALTKNQFFGIGAGQIKVVGEEVIRPVYAAKDPVGYSVENWPVMALPNATAETLAMYGILGLILRIGLQLFLFVRMKVYANYFSLFLFCFMFSYQLMGSFFTSTAEATLWVMCLIPMFHKFHVSTENRM